MSTASMDIKNKSLESINIIVKDAYKQLQEKKAQYEVAMGRLNIFKAAKNKAFTKFESIKKQYGNKDDSRVQTASHQYNSVLLDYTDVNDTADIIRGSLLDCIFYNGKINNFAIIANSVWN